MGGIENIEDSQNPKVTELLEQLAQNNIPTLDYRQMMIEEQMNSLDYFYKTDHHWTTQCAFHATRKLFEKITKLTDIQFGKNLFELDCYEQLIYRDIFCGKMGKKTGLLYGGLDDFTLFLPKYKTDYTWSCPSKWFLIRGSAERSLLYPLQLAYNYLDVNIYTVYNLMHLHECSIRNHRALENR